MFVSNTNLIASTLASEQGFSLTNSNDGGNGKQPVDIKWRFENIDQWLGGLEEN